MQNSGACFLCGRGREVVDNRQSARPGRAMRERTHRLLGGADHGRRERRGSRGRQPSASSSNVFASRAVRRISSRAAGESRSRSACKASIQSVRILGSCVRDEVDVSTTGGSSPHGLGLSNWPGTTLALTHRVPNRSPAVSGCSNLFAAFCSARRWSSLSGTAAVAGAGDGELAGLTRP